MLESIRGRHKLPALSVVVVKEGKICDQAAVGVRKNGDPTPVTVHDQFHIGSCTKSMTATLAGILIDEGKLRWDTRIVEVFPELKAKMNPQYEAVTLEQLLRHRGGVPAAPPPLAWRAAWEERGTAVEQRRALIEAVLSQPPSVAPDTKTIYSNQGYTIAGAMMEKLTGTPWEELITAKLFRPLKMTSTGFGAPGSKGSNDQPWGHVSGRNGLEPGQSDNPPAISPAGRVHCSLEDLAKFTILHLQRGSETSLLKPETLRRLHTPPAGDDYACGWTALRRGWAGGTALMHNGSNTMWYVVMWLAPEKGFAVIAGTNVAGKAAEQACDEVSAGMIDRWAGK